MLACCSSCCNSRLINLEAVVTLLPGLDAAWYSLPSKQHKLTHCWFDVGLTLLMEAQHQSKTVFQHRVVPDMWVLDRSPCKLIPNILQNIKSENLHFTINNTVYNNTIIVLLGVMVHLNIIVNDNFGSNLVFLSINWLSRYFFVLKFD